MENTQSVRPFAVGIEEPPLERWSDAAGLTWRTMVSGDRYPSQDLTAGVCTMAPGFVGVPHRHAEPEVYHFLGGTGVVTVEEEQLVVHPGSTVFVPGGAWHMTENTGSHDLRLFYCFAVDAYPDVHYEYPDGSTWHAEGAPAT